MEFGQPKKDAPVESGNYLRQFPKGETLVRFLDEPDDWNAYREHYSLDGKSFPCTEDRTSCPGCTHDNEKVSRSGRKYAAQVLLVKQEKVLPFKIPVTLAGRLVLRAERNSGTLLSRDYVILKSGTGMDTEYDVDTEDKYEVDQKSLHTKITLSIQDCHADSFKEVWGDLVDGKPTKSGKVKEFAEDTDNEVPPSKPATQSDSGEQGDVDLSENQVRKMSKPELRQLAVRAGLDFDEDDTTKELANKLIEHFGS